MAAVVLALALAFVGHATIDASLQMQLGNPSNAGTVTTNHSHYLISRAQYAMDYNDTTREPNWVSWDLTSGDVGGSGRSNFIQDTTLPTGFYQVLTTDYSGSGYDRGHMCPSADRTVTVADNQPLFYMSNMVPQSPDNNQGIWASFETYCRTLASAGNELLIICGPSGFGGSAIASGVAIPGYTWKIVIAVPLGSGTALSRITSAASVTAIAIKVPNIAGVRSTPWTTFVTSIAQIEGDTGYTFLTSLDSSVAATLRTQVYGQTQTGLPTITTQPSGLSAAVGGTATFTVAATSTTDTAFTYQWQKDDAEIPGATSSTLTLSNVQAGDIATYAVTVSNTVGSVTSSGATLVVTGLPPTITTVPTSRTVAAGALETLTVTASGSPTLTYQWRKGGIALANDANISGVTTPSLTISNVQADNGGVYDVVVTNSVTSVTSTGATLTVTPTAPTITSHPVSRSASLGTSTAFTVTATGTAGFTYQWYKGSTPLADGGSISGATTATLTLGSVQVGDAGDYSVTVTNGVGNATSNIATLSISTTKGPKLVISGYLANPASTDGIYEYVQLVATAPIDFSVTPYTVIVANNGTGTLNGWKAGAALTYAFAITSGSMAAGEVGYVGGSGQMLDGASSVSLSALKWLRSIDLANVAGDGSIGTKNSSGVFGNGGTADGIAVFDLPVASITASSVPIDAIFYGTSVGGAKPTTGGYTVPTNDHYDNTQGTYGNGTNTFFFGDAVSDSFAKLSGSFDPATGLWTVARTLTNVSLTTNNTAAALNSTIAVLPPPATTAPVVASTSPAATATNVAINSAIAVVFDQAVTPGDGWFSITSTSRGLLAATVTKIDAKTYTLTTPSNFDYNDTVTVKLVANAIAAQSTGLHPAADTVFAFTTTGPIAPSITTQPVALTLNAGATATFTVVASGSAPFSYQWRKNGVNITGNASANSASLVLTDIQAADAASYDVVITNGVEPSVTSDAVGLTVTPMAPTITTQPISQGVDAGATVVFTVAATGTKPFTYQWRHNGVALTNSTGIAGAQTATLTLSSVSAVSAGTYSVVVSNGVGSDVTSSDATLAVQLPPQPFTSGNLVVVRVGTGAEALSGNGNLVYLDEYTAAGTKVQSILLPKTASGSNQPFLLAGTSNTEGSLARSVDGRYLTLGGYATTAGGSTALTGSSSSAISRLVARVDYNGLIDTSTVLNDWSSGSSPRSVVTSDGTLFWLAGGAGGVRSAALGATASTSISSTVANLRVVAISSGQLYATTASTTVSYRIATVGTGLPTTTGQTMTAVPGLPAASPNGIFFADLSASVPGDDTVYIADESATTGGLQKYSLVDGTWVSNGTIAPVTMRYVTGLVGNGSVTLFATSGGGSLYSFTDATGYNGTVSGTSTVIATSAANTVFRGVALTPGLAPTITTQPVPQSAAVGGTLSFTVAATGTAPFTYQWRKGGVALGNSSVISGSSTTQLTLTNVSIADAGNYDVVVTNAYGTATSASVAVVVNKLPASVTLSGLTQTYNGATHSVTASTSPTGLAVFILYNGVTAAPTDAGSYSVVALITDSVYGGSANGTLVISPTTQTVAFGTLPSTITVGTPVSLSATASSGLPVTYSIVSGAATLSGSSLTATAAGSITVRATQAGNGNYAAASADAVLTVGKQSQTISFAALPDVKTDAAPITLSATASSGLPVSFALLSGPATLSGSTLTLTGKMGTVVVKASQAGNSAYGAAADVVRNFAVGSTTVAPTIVSQPSSVSVQTGSSATFTVVATGTPAPTYQWRKNGAAISGANSASYTVSKAQTTDAGSYDVVVTNSAGSVTSSVARLTVSATPTAPTITSQLRAVTVLVGRSATLAVTATGVPDPTYRWLKDGNAITGATGTAYTVASATAGDAGTYSVVVSNSAGSVTSSGAALRVIGKSYAGSYFGTIGSIGFFAIQIGDDNTGTFLGYLSSTGTPFISLSVSVDDNGHFQIVATSPTTTTTSEGPAMAAATATFTFDATISGSGSLSGTLTGGATAALAATRSADNGTTSSVAGFYQAAVAGSSASTYTIVSPTGQALVLAQTATGADAGVGSVDASGAVSVKTASNQTVTATIASDSGAITAQVTSATGQTTTYIGASGAVLAAQRFVNVSTRASVGTGTSVAIVGLVIGGQDAKPVLLRAVGPGLSQFNLADLLAKPRMDLYSGSTLLATNTGWATSGNADEIAAAATRAGAFGLTVGSNDSAIVTTLAPGSYTLIVSGADGGTGLAIAEAYDLSGAVTGQKMINISTRAQVGTGNNLCIAGFVVGGTVPKRVLIRGVGTSLSAFGITGTLAKPQVTLYRGTTAVAQNAGWAASADAAQIATVTKQVGAFTLTSNDEAVILISLEPGAYTVQLSGVNSSTGIGLVEVYEVP